MTKSVKTITAADVAATRANLRQRALDVVAALAADKDVPEADVEAALLTLGVDFDPELEKARKRLRRAALEAERAPLVALRAEENAKSETIGAELRAIQTRHAAELAECEGRLRTQGQKAHSVHVQILGFDRQIDTLRAELRE